MTTNIDAKLKEIHVYSKTVTVNDIKNICKKYSNLKDYEIYIHNPGQVDNLMDVYEGDVYIENLGNERK